MPCSLAKQILTGIVSKPIKCQLFPEANFRFVRLKPLTTFNRAKQHSNKQKRLACGDLTQQGTFEARQPVTLSWWLRPKYTSWRAGSVTSVHGRFFCSAALIHVEVICRGGAVTANQNKVKPHSCV
jgi:hypothetical protein